MPKRHGNLWEKIVSRENLMLAYKKAAKGKSVRASVRKFAKNLERNLETLRQSLLDRTFRTSPYRSKEIYEPKKRVIYILPFCPDRIVQHAVMNVLEPIWTSMMIRDTYACIKGRGIHAGSRRTMDFARRNKYALKCDISKFYPSIDHAVMKSVIRRKIKDRDVLWLLDGIIDSFPGSKNAPIGNYCSQWFGNLYMGELDHFVKSELCVRDYIRYCDDFILFANDKRQLRAWLGAVGEFLGSRLGLGFSKSDIFPVSRGIDFLGYRHFRDFVLLRKSTAQRLKRKVAALPRLVGEGRMGIDHARAFLASVSGWFRWACSRNLGSRLNAGLRPFAARLAAGGADGFTLFLQGS
ncbi:MAG: hypothetical protein LBT92_00850 [Rickettsiales bacterium]|jgi:hypothetical protein|nr:hypothetical protein [Rickettsiales bacterium]